MENKKLIGEIEGLEDFPVSYDKIGYIVPKNREDRSYEYWGQQWLGMPHYYGIYFDNVNQQIAFGIWENGDLRVSLNDEISTILSKCWRLQATTFYGKYAFAGDVVSKASYSENPNYSTSRYGIAFCKDGIYFGEFPAGYKMKKCIGMHYDGLFNKYEGVFTLPIEDDVPWCDEDGGIFPF